ncbi:hypothetical protein [Aeromonas enteropelogenes]|uniref:hypothetical protein n=1 Tax=Aeromonas enteropelogenes TaxID=29489 RepID=UPI0009ED89D0|nr:hypothetical protein [Aeromonas enteropelogenes]
MTQIFFKPYVGDQYHSSHYGVRVMILGESHYGDAEDVSPDYTQYVVNEHAFRAGSPFFTKITNLLRGKVGEVSIEERHEVWRHVAFYNYIQEFVGDAGRIRPTSAMWERAACAFKEVVQELQPDVILVLGYQMWDWLPELSVEWACVKHPSGGMSYADAIPEFQGAITRVQKRYAKKSEESEGLDE